MSELSQELVVRFVSARGGRVPNQQLVEHFRPLLTEAPPGEARNAARQLFKDIVNEVASVRAEDGVKYVCLRKKYRRAAAEEEERQGSVPGGDIHEVKPAEEEERHGSVQEGDIREVNTAEERQDSVPNEVNTAEEEAAEPVSPGEESASSPGSDTTPTISVTEEPEEADKAARSHVSGRTPRSSRRGAAREPVSPQLRRGLLRAAAGVRDSDTSSVYSSSSVSGNEEEEAGGGSVSLEPLEHAWMLSSCRARWDSLQELLMAEPGLITRRDFITGFSCLHWAAKHGQHELLAALLTHARHSRVPVNINARASGGYTPLHLAAMHGHLDVIKLLVGAYDADLDIRDYSGRKAWQYLSPDTARDVQALVGALPGPEGEEDATSQGTGRWRLSKVLPAQLIVHRLSQLPEEEQDGGGKNRADIHRKGSGGNRGKPRLNKIRFRTQIIHTNLTARDPEDDDDRILKSPIRHRPKSNVFG